MCGLQDQSEVILSFEKLKFFKLQDSGFHKSNLKKNMAVPPYESDMLSRVFLAGELATLVD